MSKNKSPKFSEYQILGEEVGEFLMRNLIEFLESSERQAVARGRRWDAPEDVRVSFGREEPEGVVLPWATYYRNPPSSQKRDLWEVLWTVA